MGLSSTCGATEYWAICLLQPIDYILVTWNLTNATTVPEPPLILASTFVDATGSGIP